MFWVGAGSSVDNRDVFITAEQHSHSLRAILLFIPPVRGRGGTQQLTQGIFHTVGSHTRCMELKEEAGDIRSDGICVPESLPCAGAWLPWGWLSTCLPWGEVKEFSALLCLCVAFASPVKLPLSQPAVFSLSPSQFSHHAAGKNEPEAVGAELPTRGKTPSCKQVRDKVGFWSCAPGQELLPRGQARGLGQVAVAQDPQWEQEAGGGTRQWDKLAWRG